VSDLAKAMCYAIHHWPGLVALLNDGHISVARPVVNWIRYVGAVI